MSAELATVVGYLGAAFFFWFVMKDAYEKNPIKLKDNTEFYPSIIGVGAYGLAVLYLLAAITYASLLVQGTLANLFSIYAAVSWFVVLALYIMYIIVYSLWSMQYIPLMLPPWQKKKIR